MVGGIPSKHTICLSDQNTEKYLSHSVSACWYASILCCDHILTTELHCVTTPRVSFPGMTHHIRDWFRTEDKLLGITTVLATMLNTEPDQLAWEQY